MTAFGRKSLFENVDLTQKCPKCLQNNQDVYITSHNHMTRHIESFHPQDVRHTVKRKHLFVCQQSPTVEVDIPAPQEDPPTIEPNSIVLNDAEKLAQLKSALRRSLVDKVENDVVFTVFFLKSLKNCNYKFNLFNREFYSA